MMKTKILVSVIASFLVVGAASAGQFLTKADERNNIVSSGVAPSGGEGINAGGDTCAFAVPITALPFNDTGTTVGATNTVTALPAGCSDYTAVAGPDHIWTFSTTGAASVAISATTTTPTYDMSIYVLSSCGSGTSCVTGADATLQGAPESIPAFAFPPGTYALYMDSFYTTASALSSGAYTIDVTGTLPVEVTGFSVD